MSEAMFMNVPRLVRQSWQKEMALGVNCPLLPEDDPLGQGWKKQGQSQLYGKNALPSYDES